MHRWMLTALAGLFLLAASAHADVTLTQNVVGKGLMKMASGDSITYIKGGKMRVDNATLQTSTIFDLDAQTMTALDHKKKEATVTNLQAIAQEMQKFAEVSVKASVEPTGQSGSYAGQACQEYKMDIQMPMKPEADPNMAMDVSTTGPVCVSASAPGKDDYANFYLKAADKGFIFSDPRAAKANPGQAKSMTEMYRQMAKLGVPLYSDMAIKIGGSGPMAAIMSRMGSLSFTTTTTKISTSPIADDIFAVPAGYKVKQQN